MNTLLIIALVGNVICLFGGVALGATIVHRVKLGLPPVRLPNVFTPRASVHDQDEQQPAAFKFPKVGV